MSFDLKEARYSAAESSLYVPNNDWRGLAPRSSSCSTTLERRERMGAAGLARIRGELSWARSEENLRAAYERAMGLTPAAQRAPA